MAAVIFAALQCLFLCGCGDGRQEVDIPIASKDAIILPKDVVVVPGQYITNVVKVTIDKLANDDIIVAIGNRYMTKIDFMRTLSKLEALVRSRCRKPEDFKKKWDKMRVQARWDVVSDFLYENALTLDAELRGETPRDEDRAFAIGQAEAMAKHLGMTRDKFAEVFYGSTKAFDECMRRSALARAYYDRHFKDRLAVSDVEVKELHDGLVKRNKEIAKGNEKLKVKLEKFKAENDVSMLKRFTGDEDADAKLLPEGIKCDILEETARTALPDDEEVPAVLKGTPLNTWSVVIDLPDTYDIYCITNSERKSVMTPTFYSGYRIYVEKDLGYVVPDDNRLRADIAMRKNQEIVMPAIGRLRSKFGCVLPHGECWDEPKKSATIRPAKDFQNGKQQLRNGRSK